MSAEAQIHALTARYPLPDGAALDEPFVGAADVQGVVIHTVGLAVEFRGECVTGSAGSLVAPPCARAYMELLERLALLTAAVPSPRSGRGWRAARSNGVAIGVTPEDAAVRARCELVERDRVLRSWYGGAAPVPAELGGLVPAPLREIYDFEACRFEVAHGIHTAGVFGFPRGAAPLVYGFAARPDASAAIGAALDECLQRLGFLWGEPVPDQPPAPEPTPSFHQEYFLYPGHHEGLRRWLRGDRVLARTPSTAPPDARPRVQALRPAWLSPSLHVARALPRGHVPLWFGAGHPWARRVAGEIQVHPVV